MLSKFRRQPQSEIYQQQLVPAGIGGVSAIGVNTKTTGSRVGSIDQALIWFVLALLMIGTVMVYSATIALPDSNKYAGLAPTHFLNRHVMSLAVALLAGFVVFQVPIRTFQNLAPLLFVGCLILLIIVLIPGIGKEVNGARRWLSLVVFNLQPSELMKVCAILYAVDYTVRKQEHMQRFGKVIMPMVAAMFLVGMLLLLEPDMGAFLVIVVTVFTILFLGGINARLFFGIAIFLASAFAALIMFSDYRRARFLAYLDPWAGDNALNKAYQLSHSLIAFGRGEVWGVGLGGSIEKLHYLPEAHTDFIMAVIGEELGFVGVTVVVLLFAAVVKRCFSIGKQAVLLEKYFAGLLAKGVGTWLAIQCFINVGVCLGLLPTKGLTLPLLSYGGSAILANCIALAMVLRVDYENRMLMRGGGAV